MNVYHLEVFFHVARHGSVSQAAEALQREQPTISALISDLESSLGDVRLFHRRPFRLTPEGKELFESVRPFFSNLPRVEEQIRGGDVLRIGASPIILRDHVPAIEKQVRARHPKLRLFLREGNELQLLRDVEREELDLAITLAPEQAPPKVQVELLDVALPIVLLVPKRHKVISAEALFRADVQEKLIALPPNEMITRLFQEALREEDIVWRPSIEVTSLELIQHFVLLGCGIGLSVHRPDARVPTGLRELALPGDLQVQLALVYRDQGPSPVFREFVAQTKRRVKTFRSLPDQ